MTYADVEREVCQVLEQALSLRPGTATPHALIDELSHDSIQLFELLIAFEKKYAVEALYDDVVKLRTVHDIICYIGRVKYHVTF
jgi:acyl carrier protein